MSTVQSASVTLGMRVTSTLASTPALATDQTLTENRFSVARALSATSTPPVTKEGAYETAIAGGVMDIDLTALATVQGAADCSGLRLQALFVKNTGANVLTIDAGPANGYEINGTDPITVRPGGEAIVTYKDGQVDVDATHKSIRITGTNGDVPQVQLLLG